MGEGAPDDFDLRAGEIEGKVVMTNSEIYPKNTKRWVHRMEKIGRSVLAGATGFIFVNHYPGFGPATGGENDQDQEGKGGSAHPAPLVRRKARCRRI